MTEMHTLQNGITVLLSPDDRSETACVVVGVAVGANHEEDDEHGLAHFFEHMCFKGTEKYPDIVKLTTRMEESGLIANAYTDRECTGYHLSGRAERMGDMLEITADIFLNSLFPEKELTKEKKVIIEEIAMYNDDPSAKVFDEVDLALFHGTAAGHNILGTRDSVNSFSRDNFVHFLNKHYTTGNTIVSIAGKFDTQAVLRQIEELYREARKGEGDKQKILITTEPKKKHLCTVRSDLEQTHIVIGAHGPAYTDKDRYTAEVFDVLLGGSMSSRLFFRVREKLGACYTIKTYTHFMTHAGSFYIYTGIAGDRAQEVLEAIADECSILKKELPQETEVRKAREFLLGLHAIQREKTHAIASEQMHAYVQAGTTKHLEKYEEYIMKVTPQEVQKMAGTILDSKKMSASYVSNKAIEEKVTNAFFSHLEQ